jgi:predicted metal-dependent phosphoesterase TrpH
MSRPPAAPGGRRIDLHTHTHFSDGSLSPPALVSLAVDRQLAAISITDHDSVEALMPAREAAGTMLELVPGIELSSSLDGTELHILGYYLDPAYEPLRERLVTFRAQRLNRAMAMVERLNQLGARLKTEDVLALAGPGVVGRPHVAAVLVKSGQAESIDDAFRRFLGRDGQAFVPRPAFRPDEAIALIHAAGGISVLAHAGAAMSDQTIEELVATGLRGIEIWHPQHSPATVRRFRALAARLSLLETGGSDYHGAGRSAELGEIPVPAGVLGRLKEAAGVAG